MSDFPTRKITIYHKNDKNWDRYVIEASYRNNSILNHNRNGSNSTDDVVIRIFDLKEYNLSWFVQKNDVIVNTKVEDEIEGNTPLTQLSNKYGKDNVHKVNSINNLTFEDSDIEELNHIKLGGV